MVRKNLCILGRWCILSCVRLSGTCDCHIVFSVHPTFYGTTEQGSRNIWKKKWQYTIWRQIIYAPVYPSYETAIWKSDK